MLVSCRFFQFFQSRRLVSGRRALFNEGNFVGELNLHLTIRHEPVRMAGRIDRPIRQITSNRELFERSGSFPGYLLVL